MYAVYFVVAVIMAYIYITFAFFACNNNIIIILYYVINVIALGHWYHI